MMIATGRRPFSMLGDQQLLDRTKRLAANQRALEVHILDHLDEIDRRNLALGRGFSSLFAGPVSAVAHQDPATAAGYQTLPGEVDVPVTASDLVVGDSRVLHAAHANTTGERRTVLTTWYLPRYAELNERLRASYQGNIEPPPDSLPTDELAMIRPHLTDYQGDAEPAHRSYELSGYPKPAARR